MRAATVEVSVHPAYGLNAPGHLDPMGQAVFDFEYIEGGRRVPAGEGGGVEGEGRRVHRVPLNVIHERIAAWRMDGFAIDVKLLLLLGAGFVD